MSECIAVIQYNILTDSFDLASGDKTLALPYSKELDKFVIESPGITPNQGHKIRKLWKESS